MTAELERRIQKTEMKCLHRLPGISFKDKVTNAVLQNTITKAIGPHDDLLTKVRKRILKWYDMSEGQQELPILQGAVQGIRKRGRQRRRWEDNIFQRTVKALSDNLRRAEDSERWSELIVNTVMPYLPINHGICKM